MSTVRTTSTGSAPRVALADLAACPGCDLLHRRHALAVGERARCRRCGSVISTNKPRSVERALAMALAGIVLLVLSLTLPFLAFSRAGVSSSISVLDAVRSLWGSDMRLLGLLTLGMIVALPLARLGLLAWVLWRLRRGRGGNAASRAGFRLALWLEPWAMADVFVVGVSVSLVKIATMARLDRGLAFWTLCALVVVTVLMNLVLCRDTVWRRLGRQPA